MRTCNICGKPVVTVDWPETEDYHIEDTEYEDDPSLKLVDRRLIPKKNAFPSSCCKNPKEE